MSEELINHPKHYSRLGIEPMDVIEEFGLDCHLGFAIKHIARAGHKGGAVIDLEKARWYLRRRIWLVLAGGPVVGHAWANPESMQVILEAWKLQPRLTRAVFQILLTAGQTDWVAYIDCVRAALIEVEEELASMGVKL